MRRHIDYYYKCFDKINFTKMDKILYESFNDYGYNFDSNKRRVIDIEEKCCKTNYQECLDKIKNNTKR